MSTAAVPTRQPDVNSTGSSEPAASVSLFAAPQKRAFVLSLLLVVATLAIYNPATRASFVNFDDDRYVTENPHVRAGLTWSSVKWALTSIDVANWHPLTWISYGLDYQLFHLNPAGYHFTSILLHSLSAALLFFLLWRATRRLGLSFFVAMIFAVHPLNVESVVWISERKNVLSTFFFLLTLGAYGWYTQRPGWKRYLAVTASFVCALASKSMVVTLPFVLLLVDFWPLCRIHNWTEPRSGPRAASLGQRILEKLPLFALSAVGSAITMRAQRAAGAAQALSFPLGVRVENALYCYWLYIAKAIWPAKLAPLYPHPGSSLLLWKPLAATLFLLVVTALVMKFRSRGYLVTGWFWFLGTLVPVIGLVQVGNQAMADRYTYIPLIGLFVMMAWGFADLGQHLNLSLPWGVVSAACVLLALSAVTYRQAGYWRDSLDLWRHALEVTNNNFVAEDEFGGALVELGRIDEAYPHFVRAAQLEPKDPVSHANIGAYLHQHGNVTQAIPQYETAILLTADSGVRATAYANLGSAYSDLGEYPKAELAFQRSIALNPNRFNTWVGLGLLAEREGKLQEAMRDFVRSIQLQPSTQAYMELGRTLTESGRNAEALVAYNSALKLDPGLTQAQQAVEALRPQIH